MKKRIISCLAVWLLAVGTFFAGKDNKEEQRESETMEEEAENSLAYVEAYIDLVEKSTEAGEDYRYRLIFVDENIIPELVITGTWTEGISLYTWRNGSIHTVMDKWTSGTYTYLPYQNVIYRLDVSTDNQRILECYQIEDDGNVGKKHTLVQAYMDKEGRLRARDEESIQMENWQYFYFYGDDTGSYLWNEGQPVSYERIGEYLLSGRPLFMQEQTTQPEERRDFSTGEEILERLNGIKSGQERFTESMVEAVRRKRQAGEQGYKVEEEGYHTLEGRLLNYFGHSSIDFYEIEEHHIIREYHLCRRTESHVENSVLADYVKDYITYDQSMRQKTDIAAPLEIDYHICDVNEDGLADYLVCVDGYLYSGSGGHVTELYVQEKKGTYRKVMGLNLQLRNGEESWQHAYFALLEEKNYGFFALVLPTGRILRYDKSREAYEFEEDIQPEGMEEKGEEIEAYQQVLDLYRLAQEEYVLNQETEIDFHQWKYPGVALGRARKGDLMYSIEDVNNDGIRELIIGHCYGEDGECHPMALYTYQRKEVEEVIFADRYSFSLYEGGLVEQIGSGSAFDAFFSYYQIERYTGSFQHLDYLDIENLSPRDKENPEEPVYTRVEGESQVVITKEEFERIQSGYRKNPLEPQWRWMD